MAIANHGSNAEKTVIRPWNLLGPPRLLLMVVVLVNLAVGLLARDPAEKCVLPAQSVQLTGRMTLQQALDMLNKHLNREGNHLMDLRPLFGQPVNDEPRNYELRDLSFWQAADRLAELSGLRLVILAPGKEQNNRDRLVGLLTPADPETMTRPPVAYLGPFRASLSEVHAIRHLEERRLSRLELTIELACEPRYVPIWLHVPAGGVRYRLAEEAEKIADQAGSGAIKWLGEAALRWQIRLPLPERTHQRLSSLTVQAVSLVAPKYLSARISPLVTQKPVQVEDVQLTLHSAEYDPEHEQWRFRLQMVYPRSDSRRGFELESYHTWVMDSARAALQRGESGTELLPIRPPTVSVENSHSFSLEIVFHAPEKVSPQRSRDWSLILRFLATPLHVPVRFHFVQVPLP